MRVRTAGELEKALTTLRRIRAIREVNPNPEQDTDLEALWTDAAFQEILQPDAWRQWVPIDEMELSEETSKALRELGVNTLLDVLNMKDASTLSKDSFSEVQDSIAYEFELEWALAKDPDEQEAYVPPPDRAIPKLHIEWSHGATAGDGEPGDAFQMVSRLGGLPNVPPGFDWPHSPNRPMRLIAQLVGKAAGGEIDLGDVKVLQVFADVDGDFYDPEYNSVVLHRVNCTTLAEPPVGVQAEPTMTMTFSAANDDRVLADIDYPDDDDPLHDAWQGAHGHAWDDKIWGFPIAANVDPNQTDSTGAPMKCLLQLTSYDDWFVWYVFINEDFSEARLECVRT